jgi:hypothetical protein
MENRGIIMTGGQIKAGGSIIIDSEINFNKNYEDIIQKLDEYAKLLKANSDSLDNMEELLDSISIIGKELKSGTPNRITVKGVLAELASSVSSVASLATAIAALKVTILGIL